MSKTNLYIGNYKYTRKKPLVLIKNHILYPGDIIKITGNEQQYFTILHNGQAYIVPARIIKEKIEKEILDPITQYH